MRLFIIHSSAKVVAVNQRGGPLDCKAGSLMPYTRPLAFCPRRSWQIPRRDVPIRRQVRGTSEDSQP